MAPELVSPSPSGHGDKSHKLFFHHGPNRKAVSPIDVAPVEARTIEAQITRVRRAVGRRRPADTVARNIVDRRATTAVPITSGRKV